MKVTAAIFRDGDKVLLMRRAVDQPLAGEWEYSGGKFEDGEDGPTEFTTIARLCEIFLKDYTNAP